MSVEALLPYVHHKFDCYSLLGIGNCTCGLSAALKAAQPQGDPKALLIELGGGQIGGHQVKPQAAQPERVSVPRDDIIKALDSAWVLGQTYFEQADSESYSKNRRSIETRAKFDALKDEIRALLAAAQEGK